MLALEEGQRRVVVVLCVSAVVTVAWVYVVVASVTVSSTELEVTTKVRLIGWRRVEQKEEMS